MAAIATSAVMPSRSRRLRTAAKRAGPRRRPGRHVEPPAAVLARREHPPRTTAHTRVALDAGSDRLARLAPRAGDLRHGRSRYPSASALPRQPRPSLRRPRLGRGDTVDEVELQEFLRERYPRLVGAVALVTGDAASAEDAVQEAIVRAWERTERGEQIVALDRWVAAVAMNLSRSRLRRLRVERLARPMLVAAPPVQPSADRIDVARALADLPRRQREVAVLRYLLDLSTEEIAEQMRTSEGTVKSQLFKARAHLAEALSLVEDTDEENSHAEHR
ncbi:MAG: sigma-70 family RNA polymerase sigma factor [Actinobacteria bacterium]|nr:MAG: sigma-70 family RNA polymerase sigma factor [Actinomycetota bacterium]